MVDGYLNETMNTTLLIALCFLLLAAAVWSQANRLRLKTRLPAGTVIYEDVIHTESGDWYPQQKPPHSRHLEFVGPHASLVR